MYEGKGRRAWKGNCLRMLAICDFGRSSGIGFGVFLRCMDDPEGRSAGEVCSVMYTEAYGFVLGHVLGRSM